MEEYSAAEVMALAAQGSEEAEGWAQVTAVGTVVAQEAVPLEVAAVAAVTAAAAVPMELAAVLEVECTTARRK